MKITDKQAARLAKGTVAMAAAFSIITMVVCFIINYVPSDGAFF
jgi:preprotein translocase subunit SecG